MCNYGELGSEQTLLQKCSQKFERKGQKTEATAVGNWFLPSPGQRYSTHSALSEAGFGPKTHHSS